MALNGTSLPVCDDEIFQNGRPIAAIDGRSIEVEAWVKAVAAKADARIDWHYSGGVAQVLHLGDADSRNRVLETMRELESTLNGRILRFFDLCDNGLYRKGVTPTSPGAIASFYVGGSESVFIIDPDS